MKYKLILFFFLSFKLFSQDLLDGDKVWYSTYLNKKINKRFYVDDYFLVAFNGARHSFSFVQNDLALNFRVNRFTNISMMYSRSMYNWNKSYKNVYSQSITALNTIDFNRFALGINHTLRLSPKLRLKQYFNVQYYFPQLEKYQFRFKYDAKISYSFKKTKFRFRPFITQSLFYYLNGIPAFYYTESGGIGDYSSPNGIHRSRTKIGVSFRPIKKVKNFSIVAYYTMQKEFNIKGFGNDLNIHQPISSNGVNPSRVVYPFNSYNVFGLQFNVFL